MGGVSDMMQAFGQWLTDMIFEALSTLLSLSGTFWVYIPTPTGELSGSPGSTVGFMWAHLQWYSAAILVFGVLAGAAKTALSRRGQGLVEVGKSLIFYALAAGAGLPVLVLLVEAADAFSPWIIKEATGKDFTQGLQTMLGNSAGLGVLSLLLVLLLGGVAVLASLFQLVLLVMRIAMLLILASALPLAVAASSTEVGKQWVRKLLSWLLAFLLYKPVAAIIYAIGFRLLAGGDLTAGSGLSGAMGALFNVILGVTVMVLSLLALPALMRFLAPAVSMTAGGGGFGAVMGALVATGAGVAGMKMMGGGMGASGGGSPSGGGGPSGGGPSGGGAAGGGAAGGGDPSGGDPSEGGAADGAAGGAASTSGAAASGAGPIGAGAQIARQQAGKAAAAPGKAAEKITGEGEE